MKIFKSIDEKFAEIGFIKTKENEHGARYERFNERFNYTQTLAFASKKSGKNIFQSYDAALPDSKGIGHTCVGLTAYEAKLCVKKMKQLGWKVRKGV